MREKDQIAGGNLRRVIRLMKYLRDHKNSFTGTRSVILTTLLGEQVSEVKQLFDTGYYNSTPTALLHIVSDLDAWLQARPIKPSVPDPSGSGVTFDHRWDQATYAYFRDRIHAHAAQMQDAYDEPDKDASVAKWQAVFGDGFTAPAPKRSSGRFGTAAGAPRSRPGGQAAPGDQEGNQQDGAQHLAAAGDRQPACDRRPAPRRHRADHRHPDGERRVRIGDDPAADQELPAGPGGLRFRDHEDFIIGIGPSRLVPPHVDVEHQRFAGHPHVLQGHRLCIYLDPAREWDPRGGMPAFLERLWAWLGDAAAGRFNAATAMYHAVGGVLHLTPGTPTLVIREPVPGKPFQHARLLTRTARRLDVTFAPAPPPALVMPVLTLSADLPLGAGLTLTAAARSSLTIPAAAGHPVTPGSAPRRRGPC